MSDKVVQLNAGPQPSPVDVLAKLITNGLFGSADQVKAASAGTTGGWTAMVSV